MKRGKYKKGSIAENYNIYYKNSKFSNLSVFLTPLAPSDVEHRAVPLCLSIKSSAVALCY
jgi:hypothetical protein